MGEKQRKLHLKLPIAMAESLQPTGCRNSKEAEAAWRLGAVIDVARELQLQGRLPILTLTVYDDSKPAEIHVSLSKEQLEFLNSTSKQEGGSRGRLVREFLCTAQRALSGQSGCPSHEGLVKEIRKLFF